MQDDNVSSLLGRLLSRRHTESDDEQAPEENVSALGTPALPAGSSSPDAKLPEGDVVFYLLDMVPKLDLRRFYAPYEDETRGSPV